MRHVIGPRRPIRDSEILERMRMTFDLYELAEQMIRQKVRRQNPEATESEIEEGIRDWLSRRPGAEYGDAAGRPAQRV